MSLTAKPESSFSDDDILDPYGSQFAMTEKVLAQLRAEVASRYEVPVDSVDIVVSDEEGSIDVSYAVIFVPATELIPMVRNISRNPLPDSPDGVK